MAAIVISSGTESAETHFEDDLKEATIRSHFMVFTTCTVTLEN